MESAVSGPAAETGAGGAAEALSERVLRALNEGAMLILLSIGHRTGLLRDLAGAGPLSSEEAARKVGLDERYVREWLAGLATAGVLELHDDGRYELAAEIGPLFTPGSAEGIGTLVQYIPLLSSVEDDVIRCFREGGGVPYERFGRFQEVMADDSGQSVVSVLHDHILPLVPGLAERLSAGIDVVDLGCGRGLALMEMARVYPNSRFVGYDLLESAVAWASAEAERRGLTNVRFEARDLSDYDVTAPESAFDLVTTFDAVHDQARPARMLAGIRRSLRLDGVYLMQDIRAATAVRDNRDHPLGPFLYTVSLMHCMTVSLAQGGDGLGTMWGREKAMEMLREAGFGEVVVHELPHDPQNDYYVVRPDR